jgi:hypothetical protein
MVRCVARSLRGRRAISLRESYRGEKMTLIGAISKEGIVAIKIINESMKGDDFRQFIKNDLLPQLRKGAVVVMDDRFIKWKD